MLHHLCLGYEGKNQRRKNGGSWEPGSLRGKNKSFGARGLRAGEKTFDGGREAWPLFP